MTSGEGDIPNFTFTIEGVDHLTPPYYIDAIRVSTNRLRFYVDNPFFAPMARAMVPFTGILLEADAVGFHLAQESKRVYAASCIGSHSLSRSTVFGPMPDEPRTLDIPKPLPGASAWTTRAFRQNYSFVKATVDLMSPRPDNDFESTALKWDKVHTLLQELLTSERIDVSTRLIHATQAYRPGGKQAMLDGYIQSKEDPHTFVNFVDGTFAHVWRDAREARRFVASSQRLWQTIMEHRVLPVLCPVTVMMQSRGKSITFTPLMPIHGDPVEDELAPQDILRLLSALIGNTGGQHRFGQATAKLTDNGEAEEIADAKDQPLAALAQNTHMYAGADGYYYITRPTAFGIILEHLRGGKTIAVPYGPLRLEVYPKVFPDGVSKERGWTANYAVERIMSNAFEPVVKTLVKRARNKVTDLVQRGFIAALFRQYGLNIRFAFLVLQEALTMVNPRTPEEMAITDALEAEMLCRALKTMFRADVAVFPGGGVMTDDDYLERANRLLYYVNSGSRPIWEQMSTVVRGKFLGCPPDYSIPPSPKQARILTWYMTPKMGFNFNAEEGMFDKVSAALPVWYGCYQQPESVRLTINAKLDAAAHHLGQQWQWLEGMERPPVLEYQRAVEVGRWKKINAHLAPEDPHAQVITEDGQRLDTTVIHQRQRSQVFELLSHSVRVLSLTRLCQIEDQVVRIRLVKALDTALRYRNTNSAVFAHLSSLLIDYLSFEAKEASITHPLVDIFDDTMRTVYFYGTSNRYIQSMCINFAKIQGGGYEGIRTGNLFFVSQALSTAGEALVRDAKEPNRIYRPYSAAVQHAIGVNTDSPALYDYGVKGQRAITLNLKASRGAQYVHSGMTLKLHYHSGRLMQIANRVLSRSRIEEHAPAYVDFRVNPDLLDTILRLAKENITLRILVVALLMHQSHMLGAHLDMIELQREEFVKLSKVFFSQKQDERRFVTDELFVGLSMAAFQYLIDIPCSVTDEEKYSDAEVVTAFTRLLAASLFAVEQATNKTIAPIIECHKAVNKVYPIKAKRSGLFFSKEDFDLVKSSIQSPMFARNLSLVMDDVLLVRRMWVVLNCIRLIYYKGSIIYDKDEDLDEAVSVADWCNKMADVQRAYAYRRLNGRFPDDTEQRRREIGHIKERLDRDADLYDIGIQYMEIWQRHSIENKCQQHEEDAMRRAITRESEDWCFDFHKQVFNYKQTIGVRTCQMEEFFARARYEEEECVAAEELFRTVSDQLRQCEIDIFHRQCFTQSSVMYCGVHLEPTGRQAIELEQITAIAKLITTTYYLYVLMPSLYKNGYMRHSLISYEECIVHGSRQLILMEEDDGFREIHEAYTNGYYGNAIDKLFSRESDLRKRLIIHERATFNATVFTPIENMSRQLVAAHERQEWLALIQHPQERLANIIQPEVKGRDTIVEEELIAFANLCFDFSLRVRHEIAVNEEMVARREDLVVGYHEGFNRFITVEHPFYDAFLQDILVPMESETRLQAIDMECGVFESEQFYRFMIDHEEHAATQRDLLLKMAFHCMGEAIRAECDAEYQAIYERYQLEAGQFRAADFEEYESALREELSAQYLIDCVVEIIVAKCTDYGRVMYDELTAMLLGGVVEREELMRLEIESSISAAERDVYWRTMVAFEEDLSRKERWVRARFMAEHAVIEEEYTTRSGYEDIESKRFYGLCMASDLLLQEMRGLDALTSTFNHPSLSPFVSRHWRRVVAEQKHADRNAPYPLPLDAAKAKALDEEKGKGHGDIFGGPMLAIVAQRNTLVMMKAVMADAPEYDEIRFLMEECVRRNEVIAWYGHFIATARAELENNIILMTEKAFPHGLPLLSCLPTAASLNVTPLRFEPSHIVSRVTAHGRRLVLTAGHELERLYELEAPQRAAYAKRHREIIVELRKPAYRRSKRILKGLSDDNRDGVSLAPILETGLMPIDPSDIKDALSALSLQQFHLLKLLLFEDTIPVEMTLRLRLLVAEHRAAMGLYRAMKEEEAMVLRATGATPSASAGYVSRFTSPRSTAGGGPFAALNASLATAASMKRANDLSLIPAYLITLAKAIADGRFYHTLADSNEAIDAGAEIRPEIKPKRTGGARGVAAAAAAAEAEAAVRAAKDAMSGKNKGYVDDNENTEFDPTTLPPFRIFEECHMLYPLPGYGIVRPLSALRRPGSSSGARRSRPSSAAGGVGLGVLRHLSSSSLPPQSVRSGGGGNNNANNSVGSRGGVGGEGHHGVTPTDSLQSPLGSATLSPQQAFLNYAAAHSLLSSPQRQGAGSDYADRAFTPPPSSTEYHHPNAASFNNTIGHIGGVMGSTFNNAQYRHESPHRAAAANPLDNRLNRSAPAGPITKLLSPLRRPIPQQSAGGAAFKRTVSPSTAIAATQVTKMDAVFSPARTGAPNTTPSAANASTTLVFHKRTAKPNRLPTLL